MSDTRWLSEAGELVTELSDEVKQLRNENTMLKLSVHSISEENTILNETIKKLERRLSTEKRGAQDDIDYLKSSIEGLQEKSDRSEHLIKVSHSKYQELKQEHEDMISGYKKEIRGEVEVIDTLVKSKEILIVEKKIIADLNDKMCKYATSLEKECKEQYARRCEEQIKRQDLEQHNALLVKEIAVLKVLGLSYTPSYRSIKSMTDDEKIDLLKYEIEEVVKRLLDPENPKPSEKQNTASTGANETK